MAPILQTFAPAQHLLLRSRAPYSPHSDTSSSVIPGVFTPPFSEILDAQTIETVLNYVHPAERRVRQFTWNGSTAHAEVEYRSPFYTARPLQYLSATELAISLAQVGQILLHKLVAWECFPHQGSISQDALATARENHEVYFAKLTFDFHRKHPAVNYEAEPPIVRPRGIVFRIDERNIRRSASLPKAIRIASRLFPVLPGKPGRGKRDRAEPHPSMNMVGDQHKGFSV